MHERTDSLIAFDFDGVIADSCEAIFAAFQLIAAKRGRKPLTKAFHDRASSREIFRSLGIGPLLAPYYVSLARKEIARHRDRIRLQEPILPVLGWASECRIPVAIVSSNATSFISGFVSDNCP